MSYQSIDLVKHFPYAEPRQVQKEALEAIQNNLDEYDVLVINAPTACHAGGQEIILYNGELRKVEDIRIGDQLMGPDSLPRNVITLFRGKDRIVRVTPVRGKPFDVTHNHILSLKYYKRHGGYCRNSPRFFTQELITETATQWANSSKTHKHCTKLWKPSRVDFPVQSDSLVIPPYLLGSWLGDGTSSSPAITNMDEQVLSYWKEYALSHGMGTRIEQKENNRAVTLNLNTPRGKPNPLLNHLRGLGVLNNKHIPMKYKTSSYSDRLQLLAGIIDTDGHVSSGNSSIEIIQKNKNLLDDIVFLARSLGFSVSKIKTKYINQVPYYRATLSSQEAEKLPLLVPHKKQALRNSKSNQRNDGIVSIEELGVQEYYGFELDGDHLYLLEDFTVTHNTGKSAIAKSLMNAHRNVSVIAPTNLLVQQFLKEFPETPTLSRLDSYRCEEWQRPCASTRAKLMKFCKGCKCGGDLANAKFRKGPGIYNYHIYLAHKVFREILVIDEAHSLIPVIRDRMSITLWRHDYKYPHDMWRKDQVLAWISTLTPAKQKSKKIKLLKEAVTYQVPEYIFHRTKDWFNGKGTLRNEPEERDCIKLMPVDVAKAPPMFWPGLGKTSAGSGSGPGQEVKKIVLLSATIGPKDIEQMGLGGRRVCYITCKSPIPAGSRPIVPLSLMSVNRAAMSTSRGIEQLAKYINTIAQDHTGIKGVVHVTYQLSELLASHLTDSRFLFHNRDNKTDRYLEFRNSSPESGRVLVACGLYEGMDLPEDAGRWQIIAKVPWPSLADPAVKHLAELDPEHYIWETMKTTMQGCGRICRAPEDYGTSFIVDSSFYRMMQDGKHLVPEWFSEALVPREDVYNYRRQLGI